MQMDDIDEAPVSLRTTPLATTWLSAGLRREIESSSSAVNRALRGQTESPVTPIVTDARGRIWFGYHQLNGWGALWRLGGANPNRDLALKVVPAALLHAFTNPPPPVPANTHFKVIQEK